MPDAIYPPISGFTFGLVLAALLELCKLAGLHEKYIGTVSLVAGCLWAVAGVLLQAYPQAQPWAAWILQFILLAASVPLGAKAGYSGVVKPVVQKRWNREVDTG